MAKITAEDRILIKNLRIEKQCAAKRMITAFPNKAWSKASLNRLCRKIYANDSTKTRKRPPEVRIGLPYVRVSPDTSSFSASVRVSGRVFRYVRVLSGFLIRPSQID